MLLAALILVAKDEVSIFVFELRNNMLLRNNGLLKKF